VDGLSARDRHARRWLPEWARGFVYHVDDLGSPVGQEWPVSAGQALALLGAVEDDLGAWQAEEVRLRAR
jgi:hypothetical protein